jgi:26S proteasome regulatory subunit N11
MQAESVRFPDTSEAVRISPLAMLKMMKHCKAGVPFEVMGIMLGEVVDEYTVECVDVFAMPQLASTVSVEAIDPAYQVNMMEML